MKYNLLRIMTAGFYLMSGFFLVSSTVFAAPKCGLSMNSPNINLVWNQNFSYQQITFTVSKSKNPSCTFAIAFDYGGATSYGARRMVSGPNQLSYQLFKDSGLTQVLKDARDATSLNDAISGSFGTGRDQSTSVTFFVQIPIGLATSPTYKPSGNYTDLFTMKLYEDPTSPSDVPVETKSVNITAQIPKIIDLSIGAPGNPFDPAQTSRTLEFGTLAQGQSQSLGLLLRTNAGYSVSFSSQNNGVLKHSSPEILTEIPYALTVNASPRSLSNSKTTPVVVATGGGQTSLSGVSNTVTFTIGDTQQKMSGRYTDFITVTAATTE